MSQRSLAALLLLAALLAAAGTGVVAASTHAAGHGASSEQAGAPRAAAAVAAGAGLRRRLARWTRQLWDSALASDHNVTGTFRGEWAQLTAGLQAAAATQLQHGSGGAVLKLRHTELGQASLQAAARGQRLSPVRGLLDAWDQLRRRGLLLRHCCRCAAACSPCRFSSPLALSQSPSPPLAPPTAPAVPPQGGVHGVEGELVLRDGHYVSHSDIVLSLQARAGGQWGSAARPRECFNAWPHHCPCPHVATTAAMLGPYLCLQGVNVPAAGKLVAIAEPVHPVRLPAGVLLERVQQATDGNAAGIGSAAAAAAAADVAAAGSRADADREELLRAQVALLAAHPHPQLAELDEDDGLVVRHPGALADAAADLDAAAGGDALSWGRCTFVLELGVAEQQHSELADDDDDLMHRRRLHEHHQPRHQQRHARQRERQQQRQRDRKQQRGGSSSGSGGGDGRAVAARLAAAAGRHALPGGGGGAPRRDLALQGSLTSRNCGVRLAVSLTTAHLDEVHSRAAQYTLMIAGLGFAQVLLLVRQMEAVTTPALAARISLLTLAHMAVLDAFLCLIHLTLGARRAGQRACGGPALAGIVG